MIIKILEKWKRNRVTKIDKGFRKNTNNLLNGKVTILRWRKIQNRLTKLRYQLTKQTQLELL